ncbi:FAD-dependent oxidoreductase [Paenibacillus woosongensis]|uniref:FAD-dependent oxidoreductase n=1 Tax=Paenibacillus woosongensis TaxID=307580 RepID=A0AA95I7E3_9BACL|nr:FAD-dependent oxidoreductase [Paenibacillus woosongensis]WHX50581.1 FAD-dependent oxidoreductase [Paenibacillus woosongensis]
MKLHSGNFAWQNTLPVPPQYETLQHDISCDCLIIGGGVSGALCAYLLAESGIHTVLIDKRTIASGSTLANTGLIQFSNDKTLTSLIHTFGEKQAVRFYQMCREAVSKLFKLSQGLKPEARFLTRNSLYFASTDDDVGMLHQEYETLRKYHFPVEWWDRTHIADRFPFEKPGAIYNVGDGEGNPVAFVHGLIEAASAMGLAVFENTEATGFEFEQHGVLCRAGNYVIRARHVIFATGYETQEFHKEKGAYLSSSYVVVTEPAEHFDDWFERCLLWETARPYLYLRTTPDKRILIGGLDEPLPGGKLNESRYLNQGKRLLKKLHELFPGKRELKADYAWGAVFGQSRDGLPFIGTHPSYPCCYFIEGYGGNGTVYSMIAAEMLTDVLLGKDRPDMEWFSLTRTSKPAPAASHLRTRR